MAVDILAELGGVTAVVLAGGLGTRLRPLISNRPKVLAEIGRRPFLAYVLDQVETSGVTQAVICTGYLAETVEQTMGVTHGRVRLAYSREVRPLGTGGALRLALPLVRAEWLYVANGDSYCEADWPAIVRWHFERQSRATLLLTEVPDTSRYGRVKLDSSDRILAFEEKSQGCGRGWINAGVYLIHRSLVEAIPANREISLERDVFPLWIDNGFHGFRCTGQFLDIGTPESFALAGPFFEKRGKPKT